MIIADRDLVSIVVGIWWLCGTDDVKISLCQLLNTNHLWHIKKRNDLQLVGW